MRTNVNRLFTGPAAGSTAVWRAVLGAVLGALVFLPAAAFAGYGDVIDMPVGVTEISAEVHGLHTTIFWICCIIGLLVFGVMFYSMFMHRKSRGAAAATFHESTTVEVIWTIVPFVILITMAWPAAKVLIKMEDFSGSEMTIKITGYQWRWHYDYLDEGINYYSQLDAAHNVARQIGSGVDVNGLENYLKEVDNPLVVPVGKKIRFLHTAADVIHAWWVPDLAVKKDSIPGFINENWAKIETPGVYRGKCAELCGRDHGFMPIVVHALPQDEYDAWVVEQQSKAQTASNDEARDWSMPQLVKAGAQVYQQNCVGCHQAQGQGIPGMFPAIGGSDIATGDISKHLQTVMNGIEGTPMQAYKDRLSNSELAAVITYQRNAFGNQVGDSIQPQAVKKQRFGVTESVATDASQMQNLLLKGAN